MGIQGYNLDLGDFIVPMSNRNDLHVVIDANAVYADAVRLYTGVGIRIRDCWNGKVVGQKQAAEMLKERPGYARDPENNTDIFLWQKNTCSQEDFQDEEGEDGDE